PFAPSSKATSSERYLAIPSLMSAVSSPFGAYHFNWPSTDDNFTPLAANVSRNSVTVSMVSALSERHRVVVVVGRCFLPQDFRCELFRTLIGAGCSGSRLLLRRRRQSACQPLFSRPASEARRLTRLSFPGIS